MNKFKLLLSVLLLPCLLWGSNELRPIDGVVAVVGDSIILRSEVNEFVDMKIAASGGTADALTRSMLFNESLDQLIDEKVLLVYAMKDTNIILSSQDVDQQVNARVASIMQQNRISEAQLIEALQREQNMSLDEFRARLFIQIEMDMVRQSVMQTYLAGAQLSHEEIREFYGEYQDSLPPVGESVRLQKLEIALRADSTLRQQAFEEVRSLQERIVERGEDFSDLAKEFSSGPNAVNGGDLGFITKGTFALIRLEQTIFSLQPGEVSSPIETKLGFHIVKAVERRDGQVHALHILIPVTPSEETVQEQTALLETIRNDTPSREDFVDMISEHSTDAISRAYEGDTDWMVVETLDAMTRDAFSDFTIGSYSTIISNDNTLYLYRVDNYDQNRSLDLDSDWSQVEQFARQVMSQAKLGELVESWRNDVYIQKYQ